MATDKIFAFVAALLAGQSDPAFEKLHAGGHDDRYPVAIAACPPSAGIGEIEDRTIICGTVSVPENYAAPEGRRIPIKFAVMKSTSKSPASDPVAYLHGGPGAGTLTGLSLVSDVLFSKHRQTRDIVTFDQRAAGLTSTTVRCYGQMADHIVDLAKAAVTPDADLDELVAPCIDEIKASDADLPQYNSANNARDVRAVMSALGYPEYNIVGISYGTRLALEVLRTAPEGVRSVVIDSVAPTTVYLYDDLFGPYADALDALLKQCADDEACNEAYPNLPARTNEMFARLGEKPIPPSRGRPGITADMMFTVMFSLRNDWKTEEKFTPWLPRMIYELAEGKTDTFDKLLDMETGTTPEKIIQGAGIRLTEDERALARVVLETAEAADDLNDGLEAVLKQLKADLAANPIESTVAQAFEVRSNEALQRMEDKAAVIALVTDYAMMQTREPSKDTLVQWVSGHYVGADRRDLLNLVAAMTPEDVRRTFELADSEITKYELLLGGNINLGIYACQEDVPYNSRDGFLKRQDELASRYPIMKRKANMDLGDSLFAMCANFEPMPRDAFHDPIVSDVPTLAFGGLLDTQTSWKWAGLAAESLTNARDYVFPEAGHGVMAFSDCANDITVAFINDPAAELNTACIDTLKPEFVLPDAPVPN